MGHHAGLADAKRRLMRNFPIGTFVDCSTLRSSLRRWHGLGRSTRATPVLHPCIYIGVDTGVEHPKSSLRRLTGRTACASPLRYL